MSTTNVSLSFAISAESLEHARRLVEDALGVQYNAEFGRPPSRTEWEHLIHDGLGEVSEAESETVSSMFSEYAEPSSVRISLSNDPGTR